MKLETGGQFGAEWRFVWGHYGPERWGRFDPEFWFVRNIFQSSQTVSFLCPISGQTHAALSRFRVILLNSPVSFALFSMEEPEELDELDEYIDQLINAALVKQIQGDIGLSTCQLFKGNSFAEMKPFASGVFVALGDSFYLLTASHVIEDWSDANKLFVRVKDHYVSLVGEGCCTTLDQDEKIDAAYIKLKPDLISHLVQCYRFLPFKRFLHHEKTLHEANFCAFGYPVVNEKFENSKLKTFGSAYYMCASYDKVFEYYKLNPLTHYALEYKGKAVNIQTGDLEKIKTEHYGLSGAGLWYTEIEMDEEKGELVSESFLIGIMTEFRKGKYECLIANRIEIILASIEKNEGERFK